ncbi:uncharacterized protein LOC110659856 [Hevea brasiliensis]|uniref:uncharacterized protein LOC110659856 n=1 Tax=Hevea brasiliensis TaxID=3981 RepID=UPI0025F3E8CF|nr:uncharacterized protein LOC110659856 [Hevea brasiliensis]
MDRSWMNKPRNSYEYKKGVTEFLHFAFHNASQCGKILCPCIHCVNRSWQSYDDARVHLICDGFLRGYTKWICHGENPTTNMDQSSSSQHTTNVHTTEHVEECNTTTLNTRRSDDIVGLLRDALGVSSQGNYRVRQDVEELHYEKDRVENESQLDEINIEQSEDTSSRRTSEFENLLKDVNVELYPGCKTFSRLSFILQLYHLKCLNGWTGKSFTMLLELLVDAFPEGTSLPKSHYEAKKVIKALGLNYEKIHSCVNDCMLFWGEREKQELCHVCGSCRWVVKKNEQLNSDGDRVEMSSIRKKKPVKVLRYFPLIPRLQRLFASVKTSKDMRWHEEGRIKDGLLRHPADGKAWKEFDSKFSEFSSDARNVRLGLATDGFNPFRTMSTTYSTWPVILVPYNMPPWTCMKQSSFILSMIIPGEKSPGNDIDVYLQPLIKELNQLWEGVETYDASIGHTFLMKAALMWTINDFPAYANLSGWSTKGAFACPCCAEFTCSRWLYKSGKYCYMGHRRWLHEGHEFRFQKNFFDGTEELRPTPLRAWGSGVVKQLDTIQFTLGKVSQAGQQKTKKNKKFGRKRNREEDASALVEETVENVVEDSNNAKDWWKKKSILYSLPYWEHNLLRHNLDVMHIEKNVCDNVIGTLLDIDGKSKDNLKARLDLVDMGIRSELHPQISESGKSKLPPASFTMTKKEREILCEVVKNVKMPDGYASNISRCVNIKERKISGLKTHDSHILFEYILPLALRVCGPSQQVTSIVIELGAFFKAICSKVLDVNELIKLQDHIVLILCHMEMTFLPSFFTIMVHLMVHLVEEVMLGGPVHYRWMYPVERAYPEGSIAEGYIADECLTFCSRYLECVETRFNRPLRNPEPPSSASIKHLFNTGGHPIGKIEDVILDDKSLMQAHRYVLRHYDEIEHFHQEFVAIERRKRRRHVHLDSNAFNKLINEKFHDWFRNKVTTMDGTSVSNDIVSLGIGPNKVAKRFSGFIINGIRFHTSAREEQRLTQNSGVVNISEMGGVNYYGRIQDIIELNYYGAFKVVMFKCDWFDVHHNMGVKQDEYGFTLLNFSRFIHTGEKVDDDPYVFSSQVEQVFYVQDPKNTNWHAVVKVKSRDSFDVVNDEVLTDENFIVPISGDISNVDDHPNWVRSDVCEDDIIYI